MTCSLPVWTALLALSGLVLGAQSRAAAQETTQGRLQTREQVIMAQASHIFEGEILQASYYFPLDSSRLYRTALVQCKRLFKGKVPAGTAQLVYKGPAVAGFSRTPHTGELLITLPVDTGHGHADTQGVTLPEHQPILFFCRLLPPDFKPVPPVVTTPQVLEVLGAAYDVFRDNSIVSDVGGRFTDLPALYRYLNSTYHLAD